MSVPVEPPSPPQKIVTTVDAECQYSEQQAEMPAVTVEPEAEEVKISAELD